MTVDAAHPTPPLPDHPPERGPSAPRDLRALFSPNAVAVVGASNDTSKWGNWIGVQALRMRERRPVFLVNRRGEPVLGQPVYPSMAALPQQVDLAVIAVPAAGFEAAVDDALDAGAKAVVAITAGFAETGQEGREVQTRLAERVRAAGAVLLGPNCLGVLDSSSGLCLSSNPLPPGPVGLISQSGNMALELSRILAERGLGFSRFASLGNQADITVADLIRAYTVHPETELIAVYSEDFGDGRDFVAAAAAANAVGKPVVLLTIGSSAASVRGAQSHTGALASDSSVIDAACRAGGVDRVASPRQMAGLLESLHLFGAAPARRTAVLADGGGHAAVASDLAEAHGLTVPEFSPGLAADLRAELIPSAGVGNPVDLAGAGERDITSFPRALRVLLDAPEVESVLITGYFGGYGEYGPDLAAAELAAATEMGELVRHRAKPIAVHTMFHQGAAAEELQRLGVPVFRAVEEAARSLGMLARHTPVAPAVRELPAPAAPLTDDGYWAARELMRTAGVDFPAARRVGTPDEAVEAARAIGGPVVVKALGLLHKSDAGGVALGLRTPEAVHAAVVDMAGRLNPPGYCVEAMADLSEGVELIVGVRQDPRFGPVAMVGLGGVTTEVLRDVAFGLAPLTPAAARRLLAELHAKALLHGVRGRPAVDLDAVSRTVAAITEAAAAHPEIAELEVNPLLATPYGCLGLDARVVLG
ncbi:acetate--CoA ligase family protein [Streptomyces cavernicola]|uniref:Acetate--CoA ligase family protein n=1 Tax=Streptomyces cavernicola TaxID=3043613 RepID=A0ABT6S591_9ACTN|nr:acetate--CoA ligase family protein [Streptomyces sp. B-S-A6]MDI3403263.1 acetate--CoA ligase family protein [Streptomyces sp. B-S-A6]